MLEAYVAADVAMLDFRRSRGAAAAAIFADRAKIPPRDCRSTGSRVFIVAAILIAALAANVTANLKFPALLDAIPVLGIAVWVGDSR